MAQHLHRADDAGRCAHNGRRHHDENAGGQDPDQERRHRGRVQMRRGDRAGIREISNCPQTVGNSGFAGTISFQPVEKFIFSEYNKTREGSDKSGFVVRVPLTRFSFLCIMN